MNFIYAEDEQDKQISFIPTIVYAPPGSLVANGAAHQVDYSIYSNTVAPVNPKVACPTSVVTSIYPDFLKDANTAHIKPESPLKFSSKIAASASVLSQSPPILQSYIPENSQMASQMPLAISSSSASNADYRTMDNISIPKTEYCFNEIPVSSNIPVTVSSASNSSESALRHQCLSDQSLRSSIPTVSPTPIEQQSLQAQSANGLSLPSTPSAPRTSTISEALFVRIIVSRCKRIAPLWFRGISSMRERNREESRRTSNNSGHTQSDWGTIAEKIREMNQVMETDTVVNLLKKLHKELPAESVLKFIKCWIGDAEALNDRESCVLSRPDAKGRMRRIDGGKGSDKVWRLDTIVGMLYHGLPMSSTDTNIMVHTCKQELCVRPQHIRFRASSVALVIVLKALAQSGYTVIPPQANIGPCGTAVQAPDESVDVFGPFSIEELQQYRSENLTPAGESVNRVSLSGADRELAESLPLLKDALSAKTSSSSTATSSTSASPASDNHRLHQQSAPLHGTARLTSTDLPDSAASLDLKPATYALGEAGLFGGVGDGGGSGKSRFLPAVASSAAKRRSLKRPPPSDETSAAVVGPALANHHQHHHQQQQQPSTHPLHHHRHISSPSPESPVVCSGSLDTESLSMSRQTSTAALAASAATSLPEANVFLAQQQQQRNPPPCLSTSCRNSQLVAETNLQLDPSQQLPAHFTSQPVGGIHHVQPLYPPQAIGPPPPPPPPSDCSSLVGAGGGGGGVASGKSTPRQPAKKRLEARTPTIDGVLDDLGITTDIGLADMKTGTGNGSGGFQLHTDTPFTPILCRAATCQSSAVASASTAFSSAPPSGRLNSTTEADDASCDEEMKTIFSARRHRSMVHPPNILETFSIQDMKHIQSKFLQQGYSMDQSTNGGFMRSTPCQVKRCASACALPNLSDGSPSDDAPPGLRVPGPASSNERPITGFASPPSLTPPCLTDPGGDCTGGGGGGGSSSVGVWQPANFVSPSSAASSSHRAPFGNPKPPAHTGDGGGGGGGGDVEANRSGLLTTPRQDFVSRIRDSPVFGGHPEIIEMLLSMRQEYGAKANRAGSSCSRPTSRPPQYFMCNFLNGCDSPSPAGLPRNIFNTTPTLCFDGSNAESLEHMRGLSFTPFSIDSDVTGPTLCSAGTTGGEGVPSSSSSASVGAGAAPPSSASSSTGYMQQGSPPPQLSGPHANPNAPSFAR